MAKGDYYFPLYYKQLLTSTIGWKDDEFGAYVRLLIHQFDKGSIPSDISELALLAPSIKKNKDRVLKKFKDNGNGELINEVMNEIYHDVQLKKAKNSDNGKKGGRPKQNQTVSETKPNGFENETEMKAILINNNKESIESTGPPAFDLSRSNLGRQPIIPTKAQVWEAISGAGGTKEMAKSFFDKHEATGWYVNNSPVVNYTALAQRFVANWKENEKKKSPENPPSPTLQKL